MTHMLDIPSTAEMCRRSMSRRSEYRMLMGTRTGPEIRQKKRKRKMSVLKGKKFLFLYIFDTLSLFYLFD